MPWTLLQRSLFRRKVKGVDWLRSSCKQCDYKAIQSSDQGHPLPHGHYILSHAPIQSWLKMDPPLCRLWQQEGGVSSCLIYPVTSRWMRDRCKNYCFNHYLIRDTNSLHQNELLLGSWWTVQNRLWFSAHLLESHAQYLTPNIMPVTSFSFPRGETHERILWKILSEHE